MAVKSDGFPENSRLIESSGFTENQRWAENRRRVESFVRRIKKERKFQRIQDETSFALLRIE